MPDLITIQGDVNTIRGLATVSGLDIIDESAKLVDTSTVLVAAYADAGAQLAISGLGLVVEVVKTEAQQSADLSEAYAAINDQPYDFGEVT